MAKTALVTTGNAAPLAPATVPGTRAMMIVPPAQVESFDVDVNEQISNDGGERAVPILRVLQANSPQVADPRDGGIPGAKAGSLFNIVTREVFESRDMGLYMIAVRKHRMVIEYVQREKDSGQGGGFLNAYEPENPIVKRAWDARREELGIDASKPIFGKVPNGIVEDDGPFKGKTKELVDSYYIDGLFIVPNDDGTFPGHFGQYFRASLAFQSTFIPVYNSWDERRKNQKYPVGGKMVEPALWTTIWRVRTAQKTKGIQKWMLPNITLGATDPDSGIELDYRDSRLPRKFADGSENPLYTAAVDFNVDLLEGTATLDLSKDTAAQEGGGQSDNPDDNIPGFDKYDN